MVNEINKFGYCGKNCFNCPSFIESRCDGCKFISVNTKNSNSLPECQNCNIKFCAEKKGISFCFLCPKFPCQFFSFLSQDEITKIYEQKSVICDSDESFSKKNY